MLTQAPKHTLTYACMSQINTFTRKLTYMPFARIILSNSFVNCCFFSFHIGALQCRKSSWRLHRRECLCAARRLPRPVAWGALRARVCLRACACSCVLIFHACTSPCVWTRDVRISMWWYKICSLFQHFTTTASYSNSINYFLDCRCLFVSTLHNYWQLLNYI